MGGIYIQEANMTGLQLATWEWVVHTYRKQTRQGYNLLHGNGWYIHSGSKQDRVTACYMGMGGIYIQEANMTGLQFLTACCTS